MYACDVVLVDFFNINISTKIFFCSVIFILILYIEHINTFALLLLNLGTAVLNNLDWDVRLYSSVNSLLYLNVCIHFPAHLYSDFVPFANSHNSQCGHVDDKWVLAVDDLSTRSISTFLLTVRRPIWITCPVGFYCFSRSHRVVCWRSAWMCICRFTNINWRQIFNECAAPSSFLLIGASVLHTLSILTAQVAFTSFERSSSTLIHRISSNSNPLCAFICKFSIDHF